jgi:catechol 2,3-dioxygenase
MTAASPRDAAVPVIASATTVGPVTLTVADLTGARAFYETVIGLTATELPGGDVALGPAGGPALVRLHGDPAAPRRDPRAPGLFHVALLFPTRSDLAHALLRIAAGRWPLSGASDHLVSEALYLADPEGNGIELLRDRPRSAWPRDADGTLQMATLRLDLDDLLGEVTELAPGDPLPAPAPSAPPGTRVGHVHLQVGDVARAEDFYHGLLGFEVIVRSYPGALFVAAGGYHHHLGLNTWNSAGASPATSGARGLRRFEIAVPGGDELARIRARLQHAEVPVFPADDDHAALDLHDPFGIAVRLRAA